MQSVMIQLAVSGIAMGFIYALVAVQITLMFNSTGLLNFAQENVIALGGYVFVGTYLMSMGFGNIPAVLSTLITLACFGVFIALIIFIPLRTRHRLIAVIATVMLGQIINESVVLIWGPLALRPEGFLAGVVRFNDITIAISHIYIIIVSIAVIVVLQIVLKSTKVGKAMTCVAQNKTAAALMGINVKVSMSITIAICFAICALIGMVTAPIFTVTQNIASMIALKGFCAAVIGGFGKLPYAIIGGLLLGVIENYAGFFLPAVFRDVVSFSLMIIFMLFAPNGFAGIIKHLQYQKAIAMERAREAV